MIKGPPLQAQAAEPSDEQKKLVKALCRIYEVSMPSDERIREHFGSYLDCAVNRYQPSDFGYPAGTEDI